MTYRINPNDEELGAFLTRQEVDTTLGDAYEESSRVAPAYAAPIPATQYTSGDTGSDALPPITDESVRLMPSRISAMYVPHESEGRRLTEGAVSPRLPMRRATPAPAGSAQESSFFEEKGTSALQTHRRPATVSDLRENKERRRTAPPARFARRWEEESTASQGFVPTAPEVAEMLEVLGLKIPMEARLSDRRRFGANANKSRFEAPVETRRDTEIHPFGKLEDTHPSPLVMRVVDEESGTPILTTVSASKPEPPIVAPTMMAVVPATALQPAAPVMVSLRGNAVNREMQDATDASTGILNDFLSKVSQVSTVSVPSSAVASVEKTFIPPVTSKTNLGAVAEQIASGAAAVEAELSARAISRASDKFASAMVPSMKRASTGLLRGATINIRTVESTTLTASLLDTPVSIMEPQHIEVTSRSEDVAKEMVIFPTLSSKDRPAVIAGIDIAVASMTRTESETGQEPNGAEIRTPSPASQPQVSFVDRIQASREELMRTGKLSLGHGEMEPFPSTLSQVNATVPTQPVVSNVVSTEEIDILRGEKAVVSEAEFFGRSAPTAPSPSKPAAMESTRKQQIPRRRSSSTAAVDGRRGTELSEGSSTVGVLGEEVDANDAASVLRRAEERMNKLQNREKNTETRTQHAERDAARSDDRVEQLQRSLDTAEAKFSKEERATAAKTEPRRDTVGGENSPPTSLSPSVEKQIVKVVREVSEQAKQETATEVESRVADRLRGEFERDQRRHDRQLLKKITTTQRDAQQRFLES